MSDTPWLDCMDGFKALEKSESMTELSAPAYRVIKAAHNVDWVNRFAIAAALRAAVEGFDRPKRGDAHDLWNEGFQYAQNLYRAEILNIADELDKVKFGTYRCDIESKTD